MAATPDDLFARLRELNIETKTVDHAPVFTVEEAKGLRGQIPGAHTKNLFLRDNKRNLFLVTLEEETVVDLKRLRPLIGAKGGLSFASPETLFERLGVRPGAVSLFAVVNDVSGAVTVVIEKKLLDADMVNGHPLTNERTTSVSPADLLTFLRATGHEPLVVSIECE